MESPFEMSAAEQVSSSSSGTLPCCPGCLPDPRRGFPAAGSVQLCPRGPLGLCPSWASLEVQPAFVTPLQDPTAGQRSSVLCRLCWAVLQAPVAIFSSCEEIKRTGRGKRTGPVNHLRPSATQQRPSNRPEKPTVFIGSERSSELQSVLRALALGHSATTVSSTKWLPFEPQPYSRTVDFPVRAASGKVIRYLACAIRHKSMYRRYI
jgi:hypothetical protein